MMKIFTTLAALTLTTLVASIASASTTKVLQGKNYLCDTPNHMSMWDSSAGSSLIRHQLMLNEQCWKPMKGMQVDVLDLIGKFSRIQYKGNGTIAYAYNSDLGNVENSKVEATKTVLVRIADKLVKVDSLTPEKEVMLIKGKPTTTFYFTAGTDSEIEVNIIKESIKSGLKLEISNQNSGIMQVELRHKKKINGIGKVVTFEIIERNDDKKYIDVRVGGYWDSLNGEKNKHLDVKPTTIRVSGKNYLEATRPHTNKELENPFRDFYGKTT